MLTHSFFLISGNKTLRAWVESGIWVQYHYAGLFQLLSYNILIGRVLKKLSGLYNRRDIQIMQVCEYLGAKPKCRVYSGKLSLLNLFSFLFCMFDWALFHIGYFWTYCSSIYFSWWNFLLLFPSIKLKKCRFLHFFYGLCEALITWDKPASLQFELVTSTS